MCHLIFYKKLIQTIREELSDKKMVIIAFIGF
jgi:hypothetical protein